MKKLFHHFSRLLLLSAFLYISSLVFAQNIVNGIVIGADSLPLSGVNIVNNTINQ